jgi:hypothetical protein
MTTSVIVGTLLVVLTSFPTVATQSASHRESLRGIKSLRVLVGDIDPEIEKEGLTKSQLQVDAELVLRKASIPVSASSDSDDPYLYVNLEVHKAKDLLYFYSLNVSLGQMVRLKRNPSIEMYAPTWQTSETGAAGRNKLTGVRELVRDHIDKFVNDYLTVNPK